MTSGGAVIEHQMKKEIAGADARRIMETNIRVETTKINDAFISKRIDIADARKNLKQYQRDYDRTCPEALSPQAQSMMWKKAKQLKDEFTVGMLSQDELHPVKAFEVDGKVNVVVDEERMRANRTVERNNAWYNKNAAKMSEYKNIMRHLCPDNPGASDIEKFRPKR